MSDSTQPLTHLDEQGNARMVDVGSKPDSERIATATSAIVMRGETLATILSGDIPKGDVFGVARIAGIQAAKQCSNLLPLCHPLALSAIEIILTPDESLPGVVISATCKVVGKTGVEMEALTAASVSALTIYDMCKGIDRSMTIQNTRLELKLGGKSGDWHREAAC
jgi:cyclic pyranopterin phosphate synthase